MDIDPAKARTMGPLTAATYLLEWSGCNLVEDAPARTLAEAIAEVRKIIDDNKDRAAIAGGKS